MSLEEYNAARKIGEKEFHARVQRGEDPYLPVLDDVIANVEICARVSLGLVTIPLDKVVGTSTKGRTTAFAANYMPILDDDTEFGTKWAALIDSAKEEGIHDPIIVLEYLNHFYVVEGNKRVSVLKFQNAVSIEATVTRIIPRRTDEKINRIYYEFLDFYYLSQINYIWFTEEGCFARLLAQTGHNTTDKWTKEQKQEFFASYIHFSKEYKGLGGKKMPISTGDAFLRYIDVFGYEGLRTKMAAEIRAEIRSMWSEFQLLSSEEHMTLLMEPIRESTNLFSSMLRSTPNRLKVAFMYNRSPLTSGWTYSHDSGRKYLEGVFGDKLEVSVRENVLPEEASQVIQELIDQGNQVIFTTSPVFVNAISQASVQNPDVKILNCSLMGSYYHIRSYYLRTYEAKFITGAMAGAMSEDGKIGYVADYPIYGMPASINAFALGAQMVNPKAKIYLEWSTIRNHNPMDTFRREGVTMISNRDIGAPLHGSQKFGLYREINGISENLAMPVWHWGYMYEEIIRSIMKGTWKTPEGKAPKALNYWWGMTSDSLNVRCSDHVPLCTRRLVGMLKCGLRSGEVNPFLGTFFTQDGRTVNEAGGALTPAEIITMDWLCDNVIGSIPNTEDLRDDVQELVSIRGVKETMAPSTSEIVW